MLDLRLGDCRELLPTVETASVDAVITDPPYPEISRAYGRMTEAEWWDMMMVVCAEVRRILKPTGSTVFILQPNSRKVGSMRGWLFEFQAWVCREWNMVQDVWWWNTTAQPTVHTHEINGLMRPSAKACVWAGDSTCYRNQNNVLWELSQWAKTADLEDRALRYTTSGSHNREGRAAQRAQERGGSTPYNVFPLGISSSNSAGSNGHGAGTPLALADWWTRYIAPPGGIVCDPFMGSGTMGIAAVKRGHSFIGFEKMDAPGYYPTAVARITEAQEQMRLAV